jgi:hypothetical protein
MLMETTRTDTPPIARRCRHCRGRGVRVLAKSAMFAALLVLAVSGVAHAYSVVGSYAIPEIFGITSGPDGNIWAISDPVTNPQLVTTTPTVVRIRPDGQIKRFPLRGLGSNGGISGITTGPDGNLWVGILGPAADSAKIARLTPSGRSTTFRLPPIKTDGILRMSFAPGPDGNVWFTGLGQAGRLTSAVGRISPTGRFKYFRAHFRYAPHGAEDFYGIVQGADGALWAIANYEEPIAGRTASGDLVRISPNGQMKYYPVQPADAITLAAGGDLWLDGYGKFQRFDRGANTTRFPLQLQNVTDPNVTPAELRSPQALTAAPGGGLAFLAWQLDAHLTFLVGTTFGTISSTGTVQESYTDGTALGGANAATTGANGHIWVVTSGLVDVSLDGAPPHVSATPSIRFARVSRHALVADLRCSGQAGTYCAGSISVSGAAHSPARRYALAPQNRLRVTMPIGSISRPGKLTLTVTSVDPITHSSTRIKRTISVSSRSR